MDELGPLFGGRLRGVRESKQGLSHARNRAVAEARHEIIAFLDDDVDVDVNWLRSLAAAYEGGDYAAVERRECGCWLGNVGLNLHLHTIRSHEKLTSEGVTFFGEELVRVIERSLPERFGGGPTDYQLVEEERGGMTKLSLLVSPRLGEVAEDEVATTVLDALSRNGYGQAQMAELLRGAHTLEVTRAEPYVTAANKVLPLHVLRRRS